MSTRAQPRSAVVALTVCWLAASALGVSAAGPEESAAAHARSALAGFGEFVDRAIVDWNVPGTALAVVAGGEVVFAQGYGQRDVERGLPMTAGEHLTLSLPGGSPITLFPDLSGRFVFEDFRVVSIDFEVDDDGKVIGAKLPAGRRLRVEADGPASTQRNLAAHRSRLEASWTE